jgi:hypothetical protein
MVLVCQAISNPLLGPKIDGWQLRVCLIAGKFHPGCPVAAGAAPGQLKAGSVLGQPATGLQGVFVNTDHVFQGRAARVGEPAGIFLGVFSHDLEILFFNTERFQA